MRTSQFLLIKAQSIDLFSRSSCLALRKHNACMYRKYRTMGLQNKFRAVDAPASGCVSFHESLRISDHELREHSLCCSWLERKKRQIKASLCIAFANKAFIQTKC